jgi:hypothetical protein
MDKIREGLLEWYKSLDKQFGDFDKSIDEETMCYIKMPKCYSRDEEIFVQNTLIEFGAIPLDKLEIGKTYIGCCRNAREAVWLGEKFEYQRYKFGLIFPEKINHFQDDDGYDVFVPIKVKEEQ